MWKLKMPGNIKSRRSQANENLGQSKGILEG